MIVSDNVPFSLLTPDMFLHRRNCKYVVSLVLRSAVVCLELSVENTQSQFL